MLGLDIFNIIMSDYKDSKENLPAETSSPKTNAKREKTKYQAFRSDEEMSSDGEEPDNALKYEYILPLCFCLKMVL